MEIKHVQGKKLGNIFIYALSTCIWCKKTKKFMEELGAEYDYVDVDMLKGAEKEKAQEEIKAWNPACSFPTVIINNKCLVGFDPGGIKEKLGL